MFYRAAFLMVMAFPTATVVTAEPATKYPSAVESIVSAMTGVVSATDQLNTLGRSVDRIHAMRTALTEKLLENFSASAEFKLENLDNVSLLCNPRAEHAARAANRSYLATVASQATEVATPGQIATLIDAIGVIFKHYSINVADLPSPSEIKGKILESCKDEINRFGPSFYGMTAIAGPKYNVMADLQLYDADLKEISSLISGLFDAINAIVNPLAKEFDRQYREYTVAVFLFDNRAQISSSATRVAKLSSTFGLNRKMKALGQFSEGMALLREQPIALSKTAFCKDLPTDAKPFETADDPLNAGKKIPVPTDKFMSCYSAVWKQLADVIAATLVAADEYDQFADAVKGDEEAKANKIGDQLAKLGEPQKIDMKTLWDNAVRLVAFGQMLQDAFSKQHRDNLSSAITTLVKGL
jgi:hypothetical protein